MSQELLIKAATYNHPEQIPISVGILPGAYLRYGDDLRRLLAKYDDMLGKTGLYFSASEELDAAYRVGSFTDGWGMVWSNACDGICAMVTEHPVKTRADVHDMIIPPDDGQIGHGFMYLRLLDLRGFEEMMIDFFEEPPELKLLIDKVLNYNLRQMKIKLSRDTERMVILGDDLGMQTGIPIGAEKWRQYLKPCYAAIFHLAKDDGRLVYMHADGCIHEIIPDLAECGADMINPQYRANGLDNIERVCKGKIAINLDLDRQLFPFATPAEIREHMEECVERLYLPEGGLGLSIEIMQDCPLENIEALLATADRLRFYKG